MIAAPASLDALWVREENLLPVGGPYQVQAINSLDYYVNEGGGKGKNVCSFIQDDAYGEAGQSGVDFAAEKLGFKVADTQRFKVGDKDVTGQVQRLQRSKCDAVFLVATPTDAGTIWGTAAKLGFAPRWIGQSPTWIDELGASPLAEYLQKTTWIAAEGTEWGDSSVEGMTAMVDNVKEFKPDQDPDYYFGFGYEQGIAMAALLEKAVELGDLSKEGIMKASEELGTVELRRALGRLPVRAGRVAQPAAHDDDLRGRSRQAVRAREAQVPVRVRRRQGVRVPEGRHLTRVLRGAIREERGVATSRREQTMERTKGVSLAKGPVGIIGAVLLAGGILGLLFGSTTSRRTRRTATSPAARSSASRATAGRGWASPPPA